MPHQPRAPHRKASHSGTVPALQGGYLIRSGKSPSSSGITIALRFLSKQKTLSPTIMESRRSGSTSQRSITSFYPLDSVRSHERSALRHSTVRSTSSRSISRSISRSMSRSASQSTSRPISTLQSVSRSNIARSNPRSITGLRISRPATNRVSRPNTSQSSSGPSTSRSISRLGTSRSISGHSTSRSFSRSSTTRSTAGLSTRQSHTGGISNTGSVRPRTSQSNTARNVSRSNTRPRTSQSTAKPRTQGKTALSTLGTSNDQQIICAISESRGISPVVGLAFVNLTTSEAVLCQISDNQTYTRTIHKLWVFDPSEILFMNTAAQPSSHLHSAVENHQPRLLPHARIIVIDRKFWSETTGQEMIQTLAFTQDVEALKVSLGGNFYATCCFAAVCCQKFPFLSH